jgi:hypothetical protein
MKDHTTCYASESAAFAGALIVTFFDRQSDAFSPGGSREPETSPPAKKNPSKKGMETFSVP